jgi:hypothetical protein
MKNSGQKLTFFFVTLTLVLSACTLPQSAPPTNDPNLIFTQAAQTVAVQLTQAALLSTPTPVLPTAAPLQLVPTNTMSAEATLPVLSSPLPQSLPPTPVPTASIITSTPGGAAPSAVPQGTQGCDQAKFVADVTIPDGSPVNNGIAFTKTWRLKNVGTCTWTTSYSVVFDTGDIMGGPASMAVPGTVAPGAEIDISIPLKAPEVPGSYRGYWRLRNASGEFLPIQGGYQTKSFFVDIKVGDSGGGKFAVTSVSLSAERKGTCASGSYIVTAKITTNGAGKVSYNWVFSDGSKDTAVHDPIEFTGPGSKNVTFEWTTSATGLWMDIYIDKPNHQNFGRATLNCP